MQFVIGTMVSFSEVHREPSVAEQIIDALDFNKFNKSDGKGLVNID
jgi:hypothetical protein